MVPMAHVELLGQGRQITYARSNVTMPSKSLSRSFQKVEVQKDFWKQARALVDKNEPARIVYFLGAILHAGPARAYALQLGLYPYLEETYKKYGIYSQNMVPFILEFWRKSLDAEPYFFKQPGLLKKKLAEIEQSDGTRKEKLILLELSWSLATRPNAETQQWLHKT